MDSTIGLTSTSASPPPTALIQEQITIPAKGLLMANGSIPSKISPTTFVAAEINIPALYPILSTNFADAKSTAVCTPKLMIISSESCSSYTPSCLLKTANKMGGRLLTIACVMYAMQQAVSVCLNVNFISNFLFMILYIFLQIAQNTCKNENYMIQCI